MKTNFAKLLALLIFLTPVICRATDITFTSSGIIQEGDVYDNVFLENDGTVVDMTGGWIANLFTSYISTFNMSGGQIAGGIDIGPLGSINILNGLVDIGNFVLGEESYTLIQGGQITADRMKAYYDCVIDIKGGVLQLNFFDMVGSDELPTINIYGYDFNYANNIISGYLIDNTPFSIGGVGESEYLRFNLIPEPTSLFIFGIGLLALRRQKRRG